MDTFVTLNQIRQVWNNPELNVMRKIQFCRAILPDSFDPDCSDQPDVYNELNIDDSKMSKFLNGNRHDRKNRYFASSGLTRQIMDAIRYDRQILYLDPNRSARTRKNMIDKLELRIQQTLPRMDASHPLFAQLPLVKLERLNERDRVYFEQLINCFQLLCQHNSSRSLAHALFLMILTAICREQMTSLSELYSPRVIEDLQQTDSMDLGKDFTDPAYMGDYHVYLYRSGSNRLFKSGMLHLNADKDSQYTAQLELLTAGDLHDPNHPPTKYIFKGRALYNDRDKMVCIPMKDQLNSLGILMFHHEPFQTHPLYYRTALFLSSASRTKYPQARRVALCARPLEEREIPYVCGVLKTGGTQIVITQQQLEEFCSVYRNYPWMEEFKRVFLPIITSHVCYCLEEGEILANSTSRLDELDRLRMMLALKSTMNWKSFNRVDTADQADLHSLMR